MLLNGAQEIRLKRVKVIAPLAKPAAAEFAPRLDALHEALDRAVCDAYGWPQAMLSDEEAILSHVLALNLARSQGE